MNVLVLQPGRRDLGYGFMANGQSQPVLAGALADYRGQDVEGDQLVGSLQRVRQACEASGSVDAIGLRATFGGATFSGPTRVRPEVVRRLEALIPHAPLHLPALIELIERCEAPFEGVPIVLVFETAFFSDLPAREHLCAIDADVTRRLNQRRYGFHGLFHQAASAEARRNERVASEAPPARILSICLEPQPEVAAVLGTRPMMVTGGVTPVEGIPGQTTCGQIDPNIVLTLSRELGWGPEQINTVLTQQSGLLGLLGRPDSLDVVFGSDAEDVQPAKELIRYRILQACGAGVAALGGLDAIVFSGRYAHVGEVLGPWLASRLSFGSDVGPPWRIVTASLDQIIAERVTAALLAERSLASAG